MKNLGKIHTFALEGYLRPSWAMWRHLGSHSGDTLAHIGASWGGLGPCWGHLGSPLAVSWGIFGGLGSLLYHKVALSQYSLLGAILGVPWLMLGYLERVLGPLGAILEAILRYLGGSRAG